MINYGRAEKIFSKTGAEKMIVSSPGLRFYLTGFYSTDGVVVCSKDGVSFYTDDRYLEAAERALASSGVEVKRQAREQDVTSFSEGCKSLAVPFPLTDVGQFLSFKKKCKKIIDCMPAFEEVMAVKDGTELELIKKACQIADKAYLDMFGVFREGMTENEAAAELEYRMRKYGASDTSFETIMAFGEGSSVPHHETGGRRLKFGDVVLMDFGCKFGGYCSDCTRTFLFGDDGQHEDFKRIYGHVLRAYETAKEKIACGMSGKDADGVARGVLKNEGLDKFFTHSLGHGIGINIHERPYLSVKSKDILTDGMVFSNEPGIYFKGKFGIRIEDTVTLAGGKVEALTKTDKKLLIL